jgi:hypothetical protein
VNYAASKLPWATSGPRVSLTLGLLGLGLWFLFDKSSHGMLVSLCFAVLGTSAGLMLAEYGLLF